MTPDNRKNKQKIPILKGQKKKQYETLMEARSQILKQFNFHSDEALKANKGESQSRTEHLADFGSDNFLHDMELNLMTNESDALEMIDEAIARLINDEYGVCLDCESKIQLKRLEAMPHARYCIKCKSIREENDGSRPDYTD